MDDASRTGCNEPEGSTPGECGEASNATDVAGEAALHAAKRARREAAKEAPRDLRVVRRELLAECRRVRFARIARYQRPWGEAFVEGFSIAFVETALRIFGNVAEEKTRLSDGPEERVLVVSVTDLESNATYSEEIRVAKTEETAVLREGSRYLGRRRNPRNELVYVVRSQEDEVRRREAMQVSLAIRSLGQRHIPRDLLIAAEARVKHTLEAHAAKHAPSERAWLAEQFALLGITREEIARYLNRSLDETTPADLVELRKALTMIENDPGLWHALVSYRRRQREAPQRAASSAQADRVRSKVEETAGRRATRAPANDGAAPC